MRFPRFRFPKNTFSSLSLAIIGAGALFLIIGITYYIQQEKNRAAIEQQTTTTDQLILKVQETSEENRRLNEQNRNYAYCNAVLLARYTQDQQPIVIEDLDKCVLTSFPRGQGPSPATQSNARTFLTPQASSGQPIQAGESPQQPTNNPQSPTQPETPTTPTTPTTSPIVVGGGEGQPSNQLLNISDLLKLNTPCLNVIGIIRTCR